MRLALFQPEIPQNTGTLMRLGACLGISLDLIGPLGFVFSDQRLRRSGMDYARQADVQQWPSWEAFQNDQKLEKQLKSPSRIIALAPGKGKPYTAFQFAPQDTLLLGSEGKGLPQDVLDQTDHCILIPMVPGMRSINLALSAAMVLGEALRQTYLFPKVSSCSISPS